MFWKSQYGEAQWNKMSEREKQKKKMELRLEEKRLRKEGNMEEALALLGLLIISPYN
jgi:hypothetical protein